MTSTCCLVLLVVCVVLMVGVWSDCDIGLNGGKNFCEIGNVKLRINETRVLSRTCKECMCSKEYWICCGMGYRDASVKERGCFIKIYENCCYQFVKTYDENIPCSSMQCLQRSHK
ncbi:hypothetical protein SNE40_001516 [Patella caerulea]|uniref:Uncharacterized protein n=1 Tax=Patella caerulea TaxID=87958 RepID=A0AAN8K7A5_PATCE